MLEKDFLFTSESVSEGHPDKIADQVSDAILDEIIAQDQNAHVACECAVTKGLIFVFGEITTNCYVDIEKIVRDTLREIGYVNSELGFDADASAVIIAIGKQSPDIARGVIRNKKEEQGAGDQGSMFGYATTDTKVLMPAPITYAHLLMQRQAQLRKKQVLNWLRPDAKSQVTVKYIDRKPAEITNIILSTQHDPDISYENLREAVIEEIIKPVIPATLLKNPNYFVNPTGRFVIGGPTGDSGLTGRKIIVDSYGSMARHGGGCFSGKDPSKVDRSAAYAARYVAKNIVAAGLALHCEIQLSYAIGVAPPTAVNINTFGTEKIEISQIEQLVKEHFDLTPYGIIQKLDLLRPIYKQTAAYGHFGREDLDLPWERTDIARHL